MKSARSVVLIALFLSFFFPLVAQEPDEPVWTGMTGYHGTDIQIHTGHGTIPPGNSNWGSVARREQVSRVPDGYGLYHVLKFADGTAIVYEFAAKPIADKKDAFEVSLRPITLSAEQANRWNLSPHKVDARFLSKYPAPFVVNDGEVLAIDVAENPVTREKLVDYYMVSRGNPYKRTNLERKASEAREFRVEDAEIEVRDYDIRRDGVSLHKGGGCRGNFIWIAIPDIGRFTFTLAPPPASAGFEPIALVKNQQISFRYGGSWYEWLSKDQIAPGGGLYRLWMRVDPVRPDQRLFSHGASSRVPPVE